MILVGQYDSPYVRRVAVSLHVLGMPFTRDTRSVFGDAAAIRTINPLGRVPALILDDGEVLFDSGAILDHLDEVAGPGRALLPASGVARRQALRAIGAATGGMDKAVAIVYERFLRPTAAQHQPWLDRCQIQVAEALRFLENDAMATRLDRDRLLQPAITTACLIGFLNLRVQDAFPAGRFPRLTALAALAEALPAFIASRPSDNEAAPAQS